MTTESVPEEAKKPLFVDLNPDSPEEGIIEVESLCSNCEDQGLTRLMLTRIPFFQEVILSSFHCDHCGNENRHIQHGGKIQDKGIKYDVAIRTNRDLNREVVKSEFATFSIPQLDFEQPATKQGDITSIEGLIDGVIRGLTQEQPLRKTLQPELYKKLEEFIEKLENLKTLKETFHIIVEMLLSHSDLLKMAQTELKYFTLAPEKDAATTVTHYPRTHEQDVFLGLAVLSIPTNCPNCNAPCDTKMKVIGILDVLLTN
ncbi:hypothetical protein LSH36_287g03017 [Paralvinella palmiformis]|uniref:Zinc finger ZPR1-type domain-containing protein n=1 Tax=Paralvinella palmiformis TaxID=53620 RepID=A0AAD9N1J9_9ANNE|nr:hypothetical protein LSH36_287g03017 [Paralvinella palmiformis]